MLPAWLPAGWLADARSRVAAFRELAQAATEPAVRQLADTWRDRHGRLPEPVENLLAIARIKALAAARNVTAVEIQGQRLMLRRQGEYILLEGRRFPRLRATRPAAKLVEAAAMLAGL
jgi:transcription-repair coupling factor (superfamily II helicase)